MNELIQSLTGAEAGSLSATFMLLSIASLLLVAVGQILLARRNDLGWWLVMVGFFANPLFVALFPGQGNYLQLIAALPQFLVAAVGLWGFSRFPLLSKFTRRIEPKPFTLGSLLGLLLFAAALTVAQFGPGLTEPSELFHPGNVVYWLNFAATALISAGLLGVGLGRRWAWWLSALGAAGMVTIGIVQPLINGAGQPPFALLFGYVLIAVTAVYGAFVWGRPQAATATEDDAATLADADAADDALEDADEEAAAAGDEDDVVDRATSHKRA